MRSRFAALSLAFFLLSSGVAFGAAKKSTKSHKHKTHHAMTHTKKAKK